MLDDVACCIRQSLKRGRPLLGAVGVAATYLIWTGIHTMGPDGGRIQQRIEPQRLPPGTTPNPHTRPSELTRYMISLWTSDTWLVLST